MPSPTGGAILLRNTNSDAILEHWRVSDPHIAEVMKLGEVRSMEVYGNPDQALRDAILGSVGDALVAFIELVGFHHLAPTRVCAQIIGRQGLTAL